MSFAIARCRILATVAASFLAPAPGFAAGNTFTNRSAFTAAVSSSTNIDFEAIVPAGGHPDYSTAAGLTISSVHFVGAVTPLGDIVDYFLSVAGGPSWNGTAILAGPFGYHVRAADSGVAEGAGESAHRRAPRPSCRSRSRTVRPRREAYGCAWSSAASRPTSGCTPPGPRQYQLHRAERDAGRGRTPALFGTGSSQTFTFQFSHPSGWRNLGVGNVLINNALDGRHA
jgi:hypothetical protein